MRAVAILLLTVATASAAPPEPNGAHPRMLLDAELRAAWKADAKANRGPVKGAIALCSNARDTGEHDRAVYQGAEWAKVLQACLVAWAATDDASFSKTAIRFFNALLDDLDRIGDGLGGDKAATRDDGYAIRNLGPYTALAYDWLHAQLTPEQKAKAKKRWAAWLTWYRDNGYRARVPGTNYQAGYLVSATLIAIAQAGESEEATVLWRFVADELWNKDMRAAFAPGGILDGGDWPEGWQYGPLAVTSYALAARVAKRAGIVIEGVEAWHTAMLRRHVYGMSPGDKVYPGGDTEDETPNISPHVNTLNAISLGDSTPDTRRWAKGELSRLRLADADYLLHDALATVGAKPALVPRATWPTWYIAAATGTLYTRTRWDASAMWFVAECQATLDIDHRHPKTGTFVLSRGKDDVIVDPSPYGSASTLTSNAPTVASAHLPPNYIPSQGAWGEKSGWVYATQTKSGIVAARCDYADQYKFQHRPSDVPEAIRDFVLLPSADGTDAVLVVADRANTTAEKRAMHLRFRVPAPIDVGSDAAAIKIGATMLRIASVVKSGGTAVRGTPRDGKDCFAQGIQKGQCDAARFPVTDYRLIVPGPKPRAVHAISATGGATPETTKLHDDTWTGIRITGVRDAVVAWPNAAGAAFTYKGPRGITHVILDAPDGAAITAAVDGDGCAVSVKAGGTQKLPAVLTLDDQCKVTIDPEAEGASATVGTKPRTPRTAESPRRSGCCGAQTTPSSPELGAIVVVGALLLRRRRRR
jgi:hypothetical protein